MSFAMLFLSCLIISLALSMMARPARACTTVLVGRRASQTGEVIVGHNEDSSGLYVMRTHLVPPVRRGQGRMARFEQDAPELPLPEASAGMLWSEARTCSPGGSSWCDFFVNANGVVVCSNNCADSREEGPDIGEGGIGYGLRRLVAEEARSAEHAVEIAASLLERYGYVASARSYHFADADEAWAMQIMRGKRWAVRRVPDDEVCVVPNCYTIRQPDSDAPGYQALLDHAEERGWWSPSDGPFDFARACQAPSSRGRASDMHRWVRSLEILTERDMSELLDRPDDVPFSVRPARAVSVDTVKGILRSHFENTASAAADGREPHGSELRPVCGATTLESTVVALRHDPERTIVRRALGRPCVSPYLPWYLGTASAPEDYGGQDPDGALATHFSVSPVNMDWEDDAWHRATAVQAAASLLWEEQGGAVRTKAKAIEDRIEAELRMLDSQIALRMKTDPDVGRAMMQGALRSWAVSVREGMRMIMEQLGVLEGRCDGGLDACAPDASFVVRWSAVPGLDPTTLDVSRCLCGPWFVSTESWSVGTSISTDEGGGFSITFQGGDWLSGAVPCLMATSILLVDVSGERRAARTKILVRSACAPGRPS